MYTNTHKSSGHENSACPIALTTGFGCRTSGKTLKSVMYFPCFYHTPMMRRSRILLPWSLHYNTTVYTIGRLQSLEVYVSLLECWTKIKSIDWCNNLKMYIQHKLGKGTTNHVFFFLYTWYHFQFMCSIMSYCLINKRMYS